MLRRLAEVAFRPLVYRRSITVDGRVTKFFVTPDARLSYLLPGERHLDTELIAAARSLVRPGACVWDIGANVGVFGFAASAGAGTVVMVEPDDRLAKLLRRSAWMRGNRDRDIRVVQVAVSDRDGVERFSVASRGRAANALARAGSPSMGGVRYQIDAPTLTLDTLARSLPPPDVLKIDVEEAELLVLSGARELLAAARPVVFCEIAGHAYEGVRTIMDSVGYVVPPKAGPVANYLLRPA